MKERPILFSAPMVRALLAGTKTQTRRIVKDLPPWQITEIVPSASGCGRWLPNGPAPSGRGMASGHWRPCPYGQPGDRLWVRESWYQRGTWQMPAWPEAEVRDAYWNGTRDVVYAADAMCPEKGWRSRPSIHMPRWASRILLEIVSVRVERLQDISEDDCWAEGIEACDGLLDDMAIYELARRMSRPFEEAAPTYAALWESINGAGSWGANPWVWVVAFRRVDAHSSGDIAAKAGGDHV